MSYGVNAPQGLRTNRLLSGMTFNDALNEFPIASGYATSIFTGDPVVQLADGTIGRAVAGDTNPIMGVFDGVQYTDANGNKIYAKYWPASTATLGALNAQASVVMADGVLFDIQSLGTIAATDIGQNANISFATAGNTYSGQSGAALNATLNTTATFQVKIIAFTPVPGNEAGVQYNNVLVKINNNQFGDGTGTVGV